ncbi:hypothetical protein [Halogranum amylolyticum]|nr:hypothetical protein [Halogranum amylolyticum]
MPVPATGVAGDDVSVLTESHASGRERGASQVVNEMNVLTEI